MTVVMGNRGGGAQAENLWGQLLPMRHYSYAPGGSINRDFTGLLLK